MLTMTDRTSGSFLPGFLDYNRVVNLSPREAEIMLDRIKTGTDMDYHLSLAQAEQFEVKVGGKVWPLKRVAKERPQRLESMMDKMEPGSVLFHAVMLVYNANISKIVRAVRTENVRIAKAGIEGLYESKRPLNVRPVTGRRRKGCHLNRRKELHK